MSRSYRLILVGTGGMGTFWCGHFLPPFVQRERLEVVAGVDVRPDALLNAKKHLGLPDDRLYTDLGQALSDHEADIMCVVTPPAFHEACVDAALEHGMDILSEKPIADTLEGSRRVAAKVRKAGRRMGVTMSHRFDQDKSTLRHLLRSGRFGDLDYMSCRFTCDNRIYGSWGVFRHEMVHPLLVEGAVHHLDLLADMSGSTCERIYARTWNPSWGEYKGDSQALVIMDMANGVKITYEGAKSNAAGLNCWGQEHIRAECDQATVILDHRQIECWQRAPDSKWSSAIPGTGESIPLLEGDQWSHAALIGQFLDWLDGGEPMATNVEDNLQSIAMVFGAAQSSRTGQPVDVQGLLAGWERDS